MHLGLRLFIGFTLSNFVACQFWCSSMFNVKVVGFANACGAGLVRRFDICMQKKGKIKEMQARAAAKALSELSKTFCM